MQKAPDPVIVALGDSTTAGTPGFRSPIEAPPDGAGNPESQYTYWLMQRHPGWRALNRGVNGERSDQIRARFARDVVSARPNPGVPLVVVIVAGVNDIYQGRSPELVERELSAMYDLSRAAAIPVVAGTILPYNSAGETANGRMHEVNRWMRERAERDPLIEFCDTRVAVSAPEAPDRLASSPDGLHPSSDGYRLMALALEPAIVRALAKVYLLR